MKTGYRLLLAAAITVTIVYVVLMIPAIRNYNETQRITTALRNLSVDRLAQAARDFTARRPTNARIVPLDALVSGGYLRADEAGILRERQTLVSLADGETNSTAVLLRVRLSTTRDELGLMKDGRICPLPVNP